MTTIKNELDSINNTALEALGAAAKDAIVNILVAALDRIDEVLDNLGDLDLEGGVAANRPARGRKSTAKPRKTAKKAKGKGGRLPRRSAEEIAEVVAQVAKLSGMKKGMKAPEIREALDLDKRELPRVMREGVKTGVFRVVSGQKRSTVYGLGKGKGKKASGGGKKKARKPAKKASRKAARKPAAKKATRKPSKKKAPKAKAAKTSAPATTEAAAE